MAATIGIASEVIGGVSAVSSLMGGGKGGAPSSQQAQQLADPFASSRPMYGQKLNDLMQNPQSVTQLPGYQNNYQQGLDALTRSGSASGQAGGGAQQAQAQKYGQDYASSQFGNYYNQLAQLSGANWNSGPNAAQAGLAAGQNSANSQQQGFNALGQTMASVSNRMGNTGGGLDATSSWGGYTLSNTMNPSGEGGAPMTSSTDYLGGTLGGGMSGTMSL